MRSPSDTVPVPGLRGRSCAGRMAWRRCGSSFGCGALAGERSGGTVDAKGRREAGELAPRAQTNRRGQLPAIGAALAGPLLITGSVLLVLRGFAFRGMVTTQHPDDLALYMPNWCFLGKQLASGHIPAWNPHVMGGVPAAADPLSGWMYLPVMALFTLL